MILFKATERNWGLIGPGDWEKRSWKISEDGWVQYTTAFRSGSPEIAEVPDVTEEGQMDAGRFAELKRLLAEEWNDKKTEASDGEAWEFKVYEDGSVVKHRETGYIYGNEVFERIAILLGQEAGI